MSDPPLPVTVIAGYLGSGKTTLINHLLRNADGRRLMVMVNDFGDINIDADLLESADEDTLTLSNGCICCTMGTELMYALSDALDRSPRPDHLVIEASGVAQPAKIAAAAEAEPDMRYAGVVTLADAANLPAFWSDPLIGAQVRDQVAAADVVLATKTDLKPADEVMSLAAAVSSAPIMPVEAGVAPLDLVLEPVDSPSSPVQSGAHDHDALYASWSRVGGDAQLDAIKAAIAVLPPGVLRLKGVIGATEVSFVGGRCDYRTTLQQETRLVAIGARGRLDTAAMDAWADALLEA
ncbi:MAG: CobW family GTP-binding protein [Pseudomonadota bacterium]